MTKNFSKHVLTIFMVMIMAVSMFAATAVVASADETDVIAAEGVDVTDAAVGEDILAAEETGAIVEDETEPEPAPEETEAETEAATEAATEAETVAETAAETVAPTVAPKNASTPKTGDNMWLYIGIGIIAVALIAIVISVVAKKKAK